MEERRTGTFVLRVVITIALLTIGMIWLSEDKTTWWINLIVMLSAWAVISYDIVIEALKGFGEKGESPFTEELLMTVSSIGAFCLRFFGPGHNEFFEGVMVMLLFQIGEFFQDLAEDKSKNAITSALDLRKEKAFVKAGEVWIDKDAKDLEIGDLVILKNGSKILCDGEVVEGVLSVDESSLTGESMPLAKYPGSMVKSGTLVVSGSGTCRVSCAYEDSTTAKLERLIQDSAEKKSKAVSFVDRFASIYTPVIMAIATIVAVVPPLFLGPSDGLIWSRWIFAALSLLVIGCPCALVISVPMTCFAGLGLASKNGVIVKGAEYFDKLSSAKVVCFDKTGTLTTGKLTVNRYVPSGIDIDLFKAFLYAAESRSTHPIAKAIQKDLEGKVKTLDVSDFNEMPGIGTRCLVEGKTIECINVQPAGFKATGKGTRCYVYEDKIFVGYISLSEELKIDAKETVGELRGFGLETYVLSGDSKENVENVCFDLGVTGFKGSLLPKDKRDFVKNQVKRGVGSVVFVGDGINDSPSLAVADVGVAMGGIGSDAAVQNSDVVIMDDQLSGLPASIKIASSVRTRNIVNICVALGIKALVAMLALLIPAFPLWIAVLADSGLALALALYSIGLLAKKIR